MNKFKDKYRIQSTRLPGWDYSNPGYYFVTICVKNRECALGRVENKKMIVSKAGDIAHSEWLKTPDIRKNVKLPPEKYIRMGFSRTYKNQFGPQKNNLSSMTGGFIH